MLQEIIETYEELKKCVFIVKRGDKAPIIVKFHNDNFFHLVGLHKTGISRFIPDKIKSRDKQYKFLKKNVDRFNNILENQIQEKDSLKLRMQTFSKILELLKESPENTLLYNLSNKVPGSVYDGDYGLLKVFENDLNCLLGLKIHDQNDKVIVCAPQSWMASNRRNRLIDGKRPLYLESISNIPKDLYNDEQSF